MMRSRTAILAVLAAVLAIAAVWHRPRSPRPDVLLITLDTLRADRLGAYGAQGIATPYLDRLAGEGVVFEHVAAPMPLTRPSHFSIFTSKYPREHGAINQGVKLPDAGSTLAEIFRERGYRTAAFTAVSLLNPESGIAQGFEEFRYPDKGHDRPAGAVVTEALSWLAEVPEDQRFFLWVHLFDPHLPYAPPAPFNEKALASSGGRLPRLHWPELRRFADRNDGDVPAWVLDHAKSLYDGEIEYTDHWIGRLVAAVENRGSWSRTLVAVTADHGECFSNGIYFEHADCLYQGAIHVPLLVLYPGRRDAGRRVAATASLVDVAPTILAAAGIPRPGDYSGRVLGVDDGELADRAVLIQHPLYRSRSANRRSRLQQRIRSVAGEPTREILVDEEKVGIVTRHWKYIRSGDSEELFRLTPRPEETVNLAAREVEVRNRMRSLLQEALERHPIQLLAPEELSDELREALGALGYL